jgi:hypothetical protein
MSGAIDNESDAMEMDCFNCLPGNLDQVMLNLGYWYQVSDGNPAVMALYRRHYSSQFNRGGPKCTPPAESKMLLMTADSRALFVWVFQRYRFDQVDGPICTIFRNEGLYLSSELIKEACQLAWTRWPESDLYTYVAPYLIKSTNPGYCFKKSGFEQMPGLSARSLILLRRKNE